MRCHFNDKDETNSVPSGLTVWNTANVQTPNVLKSVDNPNGDDVDSYGDELSNLCSLDSVSSSQKRKILECEKEDFEERFRKIQRKKQLQRATAKANLIVDDDDDSDDDDDFIDESRIYEQMDWIEQENEAMNLHSWQGTQEGELSFENIKGSTPLMYIPKLKWREERRRLLKISMAKIRGVEDPEAYLRRSVLINNTVKRLQKDVAVSYRCHSTASSSLFQGNLAYQNENIDTWDFENASGNVICKQQLHSETSIGFEYSASVISNDSAVHFAYPETQTDMPCNSLNFHLSFSSFSSDKPVDTFQSEVLHNNASFLPKNTLDESRLIEGSMSSRILKQPSALHLFSSQPCGLQYRNPVHSEDGSSEYHESSGSSSILDSVVYHSLIASLES